VEQSPSRVANERSGAPSSGPSSIAGFGSRLLAFFVDAVLANIVALVVVGTRQDESRGLVVLVAFLLIELLFVSFVGQTPGMRVAGIGVVRERDSGKARFRWVLLRTALIATIVPALFTDSTGRAMHDRAAGTVMIRTR
jgi:uncharacterized RDD family membrane protein YckC